MLTRWRRLFSRGFSRSHRSGVPGREQHFRPRLEFLEDRTLLTAGQLDPTFGTNGKVLTDFVGSLSASAYAVALQADGKVVVAGNTSNGVKSNFALARYNLNGSLDVTFGSGGQVSTDFGNPLDLATGVAIQTDGKIVVVGKTSSSTGPMNSHFAVARYDADGTLDSTFGASGKVITVFGDIDAASGIAVQGDGKIVVSGGVRGGGAVTGSFGAARYNHDGSLDSSFGTGGKVITPVGDSVFGQYFDVPSGVVIQGDGKIVVGGGTFQGSKNVFALVRYNPNGSLDASFGTGGKVTGAFGDYAQAIALQPDGKIVLAGRGMVLVRFNPDGSLDTSFGSGGQVTTHFGTDTSDLGIGLIVQPDRKIIALARSISLNSRAFAVARYNPDGSLDTSFGAGGKVTTNFSGQDEPRAVALQSDGKIVAVGTVSTNAFTVSSFALARYNLDGSLDAGFGTGGKVLTSFTGIANASAHALALQADGKIVVVGNGASDSTFDLIRYNPDGHLDPSFGADGKVVTNFATAPVSTNGVAIQSDGKIVVVGRSGSSFALARYNLDGSPDTSFGMGGKLTTDFGSSFAEADGIVIQPDGKLVVAGSTGAFAVARYNADGSLDPSFGTGGKVTTDFPNAGTSVFAVVLQKDGRILVAGLITRYPPFPLHEVDHNIALARFNPDGNLDPAFGSGGKLELWDSATKPGVAVQADGKILVTRMVHVGRINANGTLDTTFGQNAEALMRGAVPNGIVVQADGKIIAVGGTIATGSNPGDFVLARFNPDGNLDPTFGTGGMITTDFAGNEDIANAVVLESDG